MKTRNAIEVAYTEKQLLADFSVSFWLKKAIKETSQRDCLDSLRDAELLLSVLEQRCIVAGCIVKQ